MAKTKDAAKSVREAEAVDQSDDTPAFEGPASTGESLLELLKDGPRWHGDDLEECLEAVYASRSVWYP